MQLNLGEELVVDGTTYVLIDGGKIRELTGDTNTWICDFCQLSTYCKENHRKLNSRCGSYQRVFAKKLEGL